MECLDIFCMRNGCLEEYGRWVGVNGIGISIRLVEVLADKIWEVWVTNVLSKAIKTLGIFCS